MLFIRSVAVTCLSPGQAKLKCVHDQLLEDYESGANTVTLGYRYGVSPPTVAKYLRRAGVLRGKGPRKTKTQ